MSTPADDLVRVGWSELVDLPDWSVYDLPVKIDTGARSSSLHVEQLQMVPGNRVRFVVRCARSGTLSTVEAPVVRVARVASSNGTRSKRVFVQTRLLMGPHCREVEVNLVDRGDMNYPMLIGRSALAGCYIVDPAKRRLTRRLKKSRKKQP
ncbi:MAG: RimK/LysX family protein [Planctomycetota bacterium]|jgi:hypothetical protein|nr:RimK/LysX family protein [Planctomycetota bacterium]